jgi:hypothetical protein
MDAPKNELGGQACSQNRRPNPGTCSLQSADVADVDIRKSVSNDAVEIGATHEGPVGVGGCSESVWRPNPEPGQRPPHFAERRILAADRGDVRHADIIEGPDPVHRPFLFGLPIRPSSQRPRPLLDVTGVDMTPLHASILVLASAATGHPGRRNQTWAGAAGVTAFAMSTRLTASATAATTSDCIDRTCWELRG